MIWIVVAVTAAGLIGGIVLGFVVVAPWLDRRRNGPTTRQS
jgi:hypothetical protein